MGYCEESKSYQLFDPLKQYIIIRRNVIFDENYLRIKFLNSSYGLLHSDPFDIIVYHVSTISSFGVSTCQSTSILESNGNQFTLTKTVTFLDRLDELNVSTLTPNLPRWGTKTLEDSRFDVGDNSSC